MMYSIRKMKKEDIPHVQHVAKVSWNDTYEGIIPFDVQEKFLQTYYNDTMMEMRLERSIVLVSEMDGKIVGFANFSPVKKGKGKLMAIYILPPYQGKGIGTSLLQEGISELETVKELYVHVEKDNQIGQAFYNAKGFQKVDEFEEDFEGMKLQTIRMVLKV
ncbi:GNAT family N-acetyltransferase [Fervidibacillus albus]|uniref:GNAT family N-acetyltransferase n=1 Tax=Fervidibacillus albus TaxID=2980026 RepID=A0A9E8RX30_9BACI|nr:GNAT family N-acetyltransferase [Fervidibacillus albus]WAA11311.1 GNAT family N-acetyltransferase [Fervidibacillus albus]